MSSPQRSRFAPDGRCAVMVTMIGGPATNTIGVLSTTEDWAKYGKAQQALLNDPKTQAFMAEAGQFATWETYVSQTIPDM